MEDVTGEPEVGEHDDETIHEPPHPRNCPAVDHIVGLNVEGTVEGNSGQVGGPDGLRWIDEESTGQPSETVTDKVSGEGHSN